MVRPERYDNGGWLEIDPSLSYRIHTPPLPTAQHSFSLRRINHPSLLQVVLTKDGKVVIRVTQAPDPRRVTEHCRVKWPQANKEKEWLQFDEDADSILEATAKGEADRRLQTMTTIIVSLAAERFGLEEKRTAKLPYTMNNRASKIHQLRQELKSLRWRFKEAREEERGPLTELRSILCKTLMTLRRAEWHRKRRKERASC
ncbi:hypothetical protein SKAU_G00206880 [Synaphobranchus kaupii]|uniref:Uncharacterized protein n=1 Tax=Synaphobranchus kaupii TaxID=118154 RepID=A0A9Q1F8M6_SYNKA|nr:hypothetical protein SKAU_G00206880 [Synaphobranchus kaupii]